MARFRQSCTFEVKFGMYGNILKVRGPAYRLVKLPVGAEGKYGLITKYTSEWARLATENVASCVTMERPRQSGHEIEGYVRIKGKRYSAFTDGGDKQIIIRGLR